MGDLTGAGTFAGDDGAVPAAVAEVLARRASGAAGIRDVVTQLAAHRLLIPLLEVDGDLLEGDDADPCAGSDRAMAAVSLRDADGSPSGLAFTGMAPLVEWDPSARPLPVEASRAAGAVLAEGGRALLVDPGSAHAVRIEGVALARLASGEPWPEPWTDPAVRAAVIGELGPVLASGEVQVRLTDPGAAGMRAAEPGAGGTGVAGSDAAGPGEHVDTVPAEAPMAPGVVLEVRFPEQLPAGVAERRAAVIATRMSQSPVLREVFDGVLAVTVAP